jgi:hypothetical protein
MQILMQRVINIFPPHVLYENGGRYWRYLLVGHTHMVLRITGLLDYVHRQEF